MRAEVSLVTVSTTQPMIDNLLLAKADLFAAGRIQNLQTNLADELAVEVTLA
jgi:hypothetical protein